MVRVWLMAVATVLLAAPVVSGCSTSSEFVVTGTEKSVGVDGVIEIIHQREDINQVNVLLVNLPPPERHKKGYKAFVVWLTPKEGAPIKAGRLSYDEDARRGILQATTPNNQVFVQVTCEKTSRAAEPGELVVVSKHVSLKGGPQEIAGSE